MLNASRADDGLSKVGGTLQQIPTYVTAVPNGTEKGLYMAVDLGGTNFRVCSIQLHGNTTFSLTQSKVAIPRELMTAKSYKDLFSFLAKQIQAFLKEHHNEHYVGHMERRGSQVEGFHNEEVFNLGFTFSFPVQQYGLNKGTLVRWTKGFDIHDAVGRDVCEMLQDEIDILGLPVKVVALVNDTVGTLMARSYTSPGKSGTLLGAIFGTGTNGAYVEKLSRVTKLKTMQGSTYDTSTGEMIVNSEWGSFDNTMHVLPNTRFDKELDTESNNPGLQMFEKRVSGMFLGEILRRTVVQLVKDPQVKLFQDPSSEHNDLHTTTNIDKDTSLFTQHGLDTAFLSVAHGDKSEGHRLTRQALDKDLKVFGASVEDALAVKTLATAIGRRAARLSAVAIGAIVLASGKLDTTVTPAGMPTIDGANPSTLVNGDELADENVIDIGVDGSLVEFYPGFETFIREALRDIEGIGAAGERRIRIGIAKDGSGVGAALIALIADRVGVKAPGQNALHP
ncbi:MAG: hypothetical protein Q9162_007155 [Coniocarpon cinnabarinum]